MWASPVGTVQPLYLGYLVKLFTYKKKKEKPGRVLIRSNLMGAKPKAKPGATFL